MDHGSPMNSEFYSYNFLRVVNQNKETVFMAAAAHGNVQIFNMLTDLTGNLDSTCSYHSVTIQPFCHLL